jgi:diadenosine tetraphosphatase ApaH/serine/threonine PP2A family protein phosphatase
MRILVISDVHANLTALEAVLAAAGTVDAVWNLGDVVGYGPDPNECIERVRGLPNLTCLLGNHDAAALGQIDLSSFNREARLAAKWTQSALSEESKTWLTALPDRLVVDKVTLAHGSPRNPVWEYLLDLLTVMENMDEFDSPLCFVGHTHLPVVYTQLGEDEIGWKLLRPGDVLKLETRSILNPGSVGQPRDHDARAAYAIYDSTLNTWTAERADYDISTVQKRIAEAGLPRKHADRIADGW